MKPFSLTPSWKNCAGLAAGAGMLALAGCMVGPDFHPPAFNSPPTWVDANAPANSLVTSHLVPSPDVAVNWWTRFNDAKLNELVHEAADQNLTVLQAEARIRAARASVGATNAALFPSLTGSGSYSYGTGPIIIGGQPFETPPRNSFRAGLDAAWELDIFGATRRGTEAANAALEVTIEDRRDTLITLVSEVASDYINLRLEQRLLEIAHSSLGEQENTLKITYNRWQAGLVSELDYQNAKSATDSTRSQIPSIEVAIRSEIYTLSVLLGRDPGALIAELEIATPPPVAPDQIPIGLPADLLRRRPDIRAAEAQVHSDTATVGVALAQYYPQVTLNGSFGFTGASIPQMAQLASQTWSWGPTLSWPIFAGGRLSAQVELQRATLQADLFAYRSTVLTAVQEVETAIISFNKEQERHAALLDAEVDNHRAYDLSMQAYTQGTLEFINVLTAELSWASSQDQVASSEAALTTDLVALFKALGGGWSEFPERDATLLEYGLPQTKPNLIESNYRPGPPVPFMVRQQN